MESNLKTNLILASIATVFVLFIASNIWWSTEAIVIGHVKHVGINYAVKNTPPHPVVTVETPTIKSINIDIPAYTKIKIGDKVELLE